MPASHASAAGASAAADTTPLRYKALNADSYRLDSPPFTGAAVTGAGPITRELEYHGDITQTNIRASVGKHGGTNLRAQTEMSLIDNDVPSWALDRTGADGEYVEELDEAEEDRAPQPQLDDPRSPYIQPVPRQSESKVHVARFRRANGRTRTSFHGIGCRCRCGTSLRCRL